MRLPVAILAGGLATRLRPVTGTLPKALVEVAEKPFAVHQVELLQQHGVKEVAWLVGYRADQIEDALGDGSRWDMRFIYVHDGPVLLGTAGALRRALPRLGPTFFVMYGDSYLECDFADVERVFLERRCSAMMTVYRNEGQFDTSNVEFESGQILRYDKQIRTESMHHIDWGLGVFQASAFDLYPPELSLDLATVYQDLLVAGQLTGYEVPNRFYEIGSPAGIADTDVYLRRKAQRR